ncbi:unnamed protein product [Lupinus luteus]|uniref:Non-haem dioxygenase N-terminal domain-containing protein n=1 Tax=Lupinus luteus TaxID=3873 RepID=A0AAV1VZR0_LUPLU
MASFEDMVVAPPTSFQKKKVQPIDLLISCERSEVIKQIVKEIKDFGFFNVINHDSPHETIDKIEEACFDLFAKSVDKKKVDMQAGDSFDYECKNIGINGDTGEVEYFLFHASVPVIVQASKTNANATSNLR